MPWPVYSERFLHHQAAGEWSYEVPEGMRAIVTNLTVVSSVSTLERCVLAIGPVLAESVELPAPWQAQHRSFRIVAYQGEALTLTLTATGVHATLDGYLMDDNSGRTGPPLAAATKPVEPGRPHVDQQLELA